MGGHDDFAEWRGGGYRDERGVGGGPGGYYPPAAELEGDPRVPSPRGGDGRYVTPGDVPTVRGDWDRRADGFHTGQPETGYGQPDPGYSGTDAGYGAAAGGYGAPEQGYGSAEGFATERAFGVPDPGRAGPEPEMVQRGPRSGEPMPPAPPFSPPHAPASPLPPASTFSPSVPVAQPAPAEPLRERTETVDAAALRRSVADSDGIYRSKRPAFAIAFGILAALSELLMVVPLVTGMFEQAAGRTLAPLLAMIAFPLLSLGLYGLSTGAATAVQFQGPRVWLRTPLVFLPIALGLLIAAGAAA